MSGLIGVDKVVVKFFGWLVVDGWDVICKVYEFVDFNVVWGFMSWVVVKVEQMDYYFEWFNVWNKVDVMLVMYDVGGVIEFDLILVSFMDEIVQGVLVGMDDDYVQEDVCVFLVQCYVCCFLQQGCDLVSVRDFFE